MKFDLAINNDGTVQVWNDVALLHCITLILLVRWKKSKVISITISTSQNEE